MSLTELQANVAAGFFEVDKTATALQESQSLVEEARTTVLSVVAGLDNVEVHRNVEALTEAARRIGELGIGLAAAKQNFTEYLVSTGAMLPSLVEAANDASRSNVIVLGESEPQKGRTEQSILQELVSLLDTYIDVGTNEVTKADALSLRDSLNFVGEKQLDTACEKLGEDWATYLAGNEQAQIMVVEGASHWKERKKSDALMVDKIMGYIEENHPDIRNRIVGSIEELHAAPENVRVIAVDDWMISGRQMSATLKRFAFMNEGSPYVGNLEVNVAIALPETLAEGFMPHTFSDEEFWIHDSEAYEFSGTLPVKSAYIAKPRISPDFVDDSAPAAPMHVTGAHSTTDFGFIEVIESITDELSVIDRQTRAPSAVYLHYGLGDPDLRHFFGLYGMEPDAYDL